MSSTAAVQKHPAAWLVLKWRISNMENKLETIKSPTPAAIEFLIKNCAAEIEQTKQQLIVER